MKEFVALQMKLLSWKLTILIYVPFFFSLFAYFYFVFFLGFGRRTNSTTFNSTCGQDSVYVRDGRQQKRTMRAGTRGYRAPEVLLKCTYQSAALDMFSAGVFGLSLMSCRLPFFVAADDLQCLAEYMAVFGSDNIHAFANLLKKDLRVRRSRTLSEEASMKEDGVPLKDLVENLRPEEQPMSFSDQFVNIVEQCLMIDARNRLTAEAAHQHPYFAERGLRQ
eukprot:m.29421 g.29421  ORF g.29421 m.29421 type:complete len:221 (-) comp6152_c0_seq2:53-715(-)